MPNFQLPAGTDISVVAWQDKLQEHLSKASQSVMIHSCDLSEDWLQLPYTIDQLSRQASHGPYAFHFLVNARGGDYNMKHPITKLAKLMPHRIRLKSVSSDHATMDKGFLLIDGKIGTWLRPFSETSHSSWMRPHHVEHMVQWFQKAWEHSVQREESELQKLLWQDQLNEYLATSTRSIMIHSYCFAEESLRLPSVLERLSQEARRGRRTIHILVNQASHFTERAHPLAQLINQMPSLIQVREPSHGHAEIHKSFIVIDDKIGTWLKPLAKTSSTNWMRPYRARQLGYWYKEAWEFGREAPNFKEFKI